MDERYITKPRFDSADLPTDAARHRQLSMFVVLGIALVVGIATFLLAVADIGWVRPWLDQYLVPTAVLIFAGLLMGWAYYAGVQRLYIYAAFVLLAYIASFWLTLPFPIYLSGIGIGVTIVGLIRMARYVEEHPQLSGSG